MHRSHQVSVKGQCQSSNDSSRKKNIFLTEKLFYTIFFTEKQDSEMRVRECVCVLMRVTKLIMKIKTVSLEFSGFLVFNDEELSNQRHVYNNWKRNIIFFNQLSHKILRLVLKKSEKISIRNQRRKKKKSEKKPGPRLSHVTCVPTYPIQ